jgi:hypothetical protein
VGLTLSPEGSDSTSPNAADPCLSWASVMRLTRAEISGTWLVPESVTRALVSLDLQTYQQ